MAMTDSPGMNRRHFLRHLAGLSALAVPGWEWVQGLRAAAPALKKDGKSLIILWMGGGPSHMDLWDLKPESTNGGEFKPIQTGVSGIQISEILPTVARQFKHLNIIRSLQSNEGDHMRGTVLMNTGWQPSPVVPYPSIGALASSLLGSKDLALPGFIGVGGTAQSVGAGFLGTMYAPFTVQNAGQSPANLKPPPGLGANEMEQMERIRRRQRFFYTVEDHFAASLFPDVQKPAERKAMGDAASAHALVYKKAFDLTVSPIRTVFEVRNEPKKIIDAYGGERNGFGMGCLLARKLVEKGVTCVEVDLGGWDNHGTIFPALRTNLGPRLDKGMGALVEELVSRGLWKNTVVVWLGEFGRTPRINQNAGRDHWGRCWSVVLGGGAMKGGLVHGATNADGNDIADGRVKVGDLFATIFKAIGIDPTSKVRDNMGRPLPLIEGEGAPIKAFF